MPSSTADVMIRLLGGFEVAVDGTPVPDAAFAGRRARELVQLLALADRHRLLRDQAVEALWPHLDAGAGAANLRKAAHHARQALGDPDGVVLRGGEVLLFPGRSLKTDVERFRALAEQALEAGELVLCQEAAAAYQGELLPDSRYEEWTLRDRERLHDELIGVLRAGRCWAALAETEPADEEAHRELMRSALAVGARAEAVRWYGRLRDRLAVDLGVAPSAATLELYEQCVAGTTIGAVGLVGRSLEEAALAAALSPGGGDRPTAVIISGPAGIGKTALCRAVARLAEERGLSAVHVAVSASAEPYGAVRQLVETITSTHPGVLQAIPEPSRHVLALLTPVAGVAPPTLGPTGRHQFVGAVRRLLQAAAGPAGLVLVVDDVHSADIATLDLLAQLVGAHAALQVVLALRPEPGNVTLHRHLARLRRTARVLVLDLGPLDGADAERLLESVAPGHLDPAEVARIVALAQGNPFALLELARGAGGHGRTPRDVASAITDRLVDLDEQATAMIKRIALAGDHVDTVTALALAGLSEAEGFVLLDRALEAGVLVVVDGRYRFQHELVRQLLVDQVPPHERAAVHRDAARRLAALGAAPSEVGRHWVAGGRPAEAVVPLVDAARHAISLGALADAVLLLTPVLDHDPHHGDALRLRAEALDVMGAPEALAAYDLAIAAAGDVAAEDLRAQRALAQLKQGDVTGALRSLDGVRPTSVDGRLAEALTYSGAAALGFTDPAAGTERAAACRRLALETGDRSAIVVASWAHAAAAHARGELRESVLTDLRETHDIPDLAVRVFDGQLCVTQRLLYGARPYDDVIAFADSLTAEATRLGAGRGRAFGLTLRGEAELLAGRLDDAERDLQEGARLHRSIAGATGEALALQRLSEVAVHRRDLAAAQIRLDEALDLARTTDIGFHLLDRIYGSRISMAAGPDEGLLALEEAEEAVRGGLETCPGCRITFAVPAAIAAARGGAVDQAAEYEGAVEFLADRVMRLPAWTASLAEVRGHIALARGDAEGAAALFTAAASGFAAAGQPLDHARCAAQA